MPARPPTTDGHLSRDKQHLAALQRKRRAGRARIDYMPSPESLAYLEAKRAQLLPRPITATNSAVLNAIVIEWAELTGAKKPEVVEAKSSEEASGINGQIRARAYDFGGQSSPVTADPLATVKPNGAPCRVICGASKRRDGLPCRSYSEPNKSRCRFHGGRSTGPKTTLGKSISRSNLKQYRG